jgi:ferrous iron transport protein B
VSTFRIDYGPSIESAIDVLIEQIDATPGIGGVYPSRWLAIALIDRDPGIDKKMFSIPGGPDLLETRDQQLNDLSSSTDDIADTAIAGRRFDAVHGIFAAVSDGSQAHRLTRTDRIDSVVTNRYLGIPIFLAAMWIVFKITTDIAGVFLDWVDGAIAGPITQLVSAVIDAVGLGGTWVESLIVNGVVAGVGAVLVFIPVLISLYLALAFLEDSGYMARAAFVMDRLMRGVGLQGKSFLPMLVGFGCTVPAVYATRTLDNERDRILTSLLVPFMSCGARLPVYVLMSAVFFPSHAGLVVFSMYLLGIAVALVIGLVLRSTVLPATEYAPTIMEMPPYRMPTLRTIWSQTRVRIKAFIESAGTIIVVTMLAVWLLMAIPVSGAGTFADTDIDDSAFAAIAGVVAPVFEPAGFGSWEATGSLMSGFVAKEVVIGTMAQVYGVEDEEIAEDSLSILDSVMDLVGGFGAASVDAVKAVPGMVGIHIGDADGEGDSSALMSSIRIGFEDSSSGHGGLAALAFMVFVLLYTPCMAAVGAIRHEIGTRWMWASVVGQSLIAWVMAVVVFQGGMLLGFR